MYEKVSRAHFEGGLSTRHRANAATRVSLLASAAVIGVLATLPAAAQETQADKNQPTETIIVTAQRRAERLQDVPITITSVSSDQLDQVNAQTTSDIMKLTPALRYDSQGSFVQPTIRGVGTLLTGPSFGTNVGTYVDGFYLVDALGFDFQLLNIESIQVLKGPQGTLFGRNTSGGAIQVNTTKPSTETRATVEASYGSYNAQEYKGYVTTGLTDKIAVDVAGIFSKGDGYVKNIATGSNTDGAYQNWSIRTGIKADLTDQISVLLRYQHVNTDDPSNLLANAALVNGQPTTPVRFIPGEVVATKPFELSYQYPQNFQVRTDSYQLTTTADLNFATLTSYTQYRQERYKNYQELTYGSPEVVHVLFTAPEHTVTQEFLLTSKPGSRLQWTAGGFYLDDKSTLLADLAFGNTSNFFFAGGSTSVTRTLAGYADATYEVVDNLFLTGGIRYSHDEIKNPINILSTGPVTLANLSGNKATPRAVVRYAMDSRSSVYASFTRGYKAALVNLGSINPTPINPEGISAYEIGYKYAAQRLSFDLSSYYYDYKNLQVSNTSVVNGQTLSNITNAASSHIYGVEGQVRYEILSNFEISAGAAYTHAKYVKFPGAPAYNPITIAVTPVDASGFTMPRAPQFTSTLNLRYTTDLAGGKLGLSSNLYYTSKVYFDPANAYSQNGYATLGLRAEWTDPSDRYTIAVYGNNVTDHTYVNQILANAAIGNVWAPPATFGGSIRVKFR